FTLFSFTDTPPTQLYTLSLHDALPIYRRVFAQDEQTIGFVGQAQFFGRAHHALADDAEDLAFLDDEWLFLARLQRQRVVRQDERSEEHTSELQSPCNLVCRLLLEKKK